MSFEVKDSGARQQYDSGMQRDTEEGKVDYTYVLKGPMLARWAVHLMKGAEKYNRDNWMLGDGTEELERAKRSALRHLIQWLNGDVDEDHAAAVFFNVNAAEYFEQRIAQNSDAYEQLAQELNEDLVANRERFATEEEDDIEGTPV